MNNASKAKIKVRKNFSGFLLATSELKDEFLGNFYLNFGDIEVIQEPTTFQNALVIKDFSNSIDLAKIY